VWDRVSDPVMAGRRPASTHSVPLKEGPLAQTASNSTGSVRTSDKQLFCCKSIDKLIADANEPGHKLKKTLGPWSLTALGIGAIIGSGIFVLTGTAAAGEYFKAPSILHAQVLDLIVNFLRGGGTSNVLMHGRPPAGPSIAISFVLVAMACSFAGHLVFLCHVVRASPGCRGRGRLGWPKRIHIS